MTFLGIDRTLHPSLDEINFLQAGTGAVQRDAQSKMRDIVSVKDFGAVGDGVTDDTAAIQAAIDAGKPYSTSTINGRLIYFPPGRYKVSTIDLTACHGVHLLGAGAYATEIFTSGTNQVIKAIGSSSAPLNKAGVTEMIIRGGGAANASAHGIDIQWGHTCYLENLVFFGCRHALNLAHQFQTYLTSINVHGEGTDQNYIGVFMDVTDLTFIDNAVIANGVMVQSTTGYGFRIINGQGSKFVNCEAGGSPMIHGWYIGDPASGTVKCQWIHFANCLGDSTSSATWLFRQGTASELSQMQLSNCWGSNGDHGFFFDGARNMVLTGTQGHGSAKSGVTLNSCQEIVLSGGVFQANNEDAGAAIADVMIQNSLYCIVTGITSNTNVAGKSLIETAGTDGSIIYGNNLFQGATIIGAASRVFRNTAFVTEASGTGTIADSTTVATITHGLSRTPAAKDIWVTFTENPSTDPGNIWIDTITSTQFNVNCRTNPGASHLDFSWGARVT